MKGARKGEGYKGSVTSSFSPTLSFSEVSSHFIFRHVTSSHSSSWQGKRGTGLSYYRARYYDPRLQRFTGDDPTRTFDSAGYALTITETRGTRLARTTTIDREHDAPGDERHRPAEP